MSEMLPKSTNQVKRCAQQFSADVNPDNAVDLLLLADRHYLAQLKQVYVCVHVSMCLYGWVWMCTFERLHVLAHMCVCGCEYIFMTMSTHIYGYSLSLNHLVKTAQEVMTKIVAEKKRYLASKKFNSQMKKNPSLLIQLFSM